MKKKGRILVALVFLMTAAFGCKVVNFAGEDIFLTFTIDRTFDVSDSGTAFNSSVQVDLQDVFGDIDFASVEEISISAIELTVTRNNTGPSTTASGRIAFNRVDSPFPTDIVLATFSNVNLNSVLGTPMTPFGALALLDINAAGIAQFRAAAASVPVIRLSVSGTVSNPPVDFSGRVVLVMQVKLRTS